MEPDNTKDQADAKSLVIVKQKEELSKEQQAFNRLVKRIEKLRQEIQKTAIQLDEKLQYCREHVFPLREQIFQENVKYVISLFDLYESKKWNKKDDQYLTEIISDYLYHVMGEGSEMEEKLKEIYEKIEGQTHDEALEEDFEMQKQMMNAFLNTHGVKVDSATKDMGPEEMARYFAEKQKEIYEADMRRRAAPKPEKKKTKKQLEKERIEKEKEELQSKNISKIYKQLAKIFHPDLEPDIDKRKYKEELMKQLTIAYEKNDLHTLLRLELEYIQTDGDAAGNLAGDKLKIYNKVLNDQAMELDHELATLSYHPQYAALASLVGEPYRIKGTNFTQVKKMMERDLIKLAAEVVELTGDKETALKAVKKMIAEFKKRKKEEEEDFFF